MANVSLILHAEFSLISFVAFQEQEKWIGSDLKASGDFKLEEQPS